MTIVEAFGKIYPMYNVGIMGFLNKWVSNTIERKQETGESDIKKSFKDTWSAYKEYFKKFGYIAGVLVILAIFVYIIVRKMSK